MIASVGVYLAVAVGLIALAFGLTRRRAETLLTVASVALTLLAAEAVLRLAYPPSWRPLRKIPSREYHHVDRPRATMYDGKVEGKQVVVRTNEDGFRTEHGREEFVGHRTRVAVLGDSFVFGSNVPQDAAFPQVMERLLREGGTDVAVLDAGTISYSPLLAQRVFEGVVAHYRPTVVVYLLDVTDIGDDYNYERELRGTGADTHFEWKGVRVTPYYGALGQVAHFDEILAALERPLTSLMHGGKDDSISSDDYDWYKFSAEVGGVTETNRFFIYRHPLDQTRPFFDRTYGYVTALAASVRKSGAEFVLVVSPRFHHWNPKECAKNWEEDEYGRNEPYQYEYFKYFDEHREEAPFEIFDLLPAFQATQEYPLVFRTDPHWNESGHKFVARVLVDHLRERGLLADHRAAQALPLAGGRR